MTVPSSWIKGDVNFGGDGAVAVFVEEGEGFLELGDLFFVELVGHLSFEINKYITTHSNCINHHTFIAFKNYNIIRCKSSHTPPSASGRKGSN